MSNSNDDLKYIEQYTNKLEQDIETDENEIDSEIISDEKISKERLNTLYNDLYARNTEKETEIKQLIIDISSKINNAVDVSLVGNIITNLVGSTIKNDQNLIKIMDILTNKNAKQNNNSGNNNEQNSDVVLSVEDKKALIDKFLNSSQTPQSNDDNISSKIINFKK